MRFIPDALQVEGLGSVLREGERVSAAGEKYALGGSLAAALLGERCDRQSAEAERLEHLDSDSELPLASVDEEQVGQVAVFESSLKPPLENLLHAAEVVRSDDSLDPVFSVAVPYRLAILEGDHRADCQRSLEIRDVVAFDSFRADRQLQVPFQRTEERLHPLLLIQRDAEAVAGVAARQAHDGRLVSLLGKQDARPGAAFLGEPGLEELAVAKIRIAEHLGRDVAVGEIVLGQEAREHLRSGEPGSKAVSFRVDDLSLSNEDRLDRDEVALADDGEGVDVSEPELLDLLGLEDLGDGRELIPVAGGELVGPRPGGFPHSLLDEAFEVPAPALEQHHHLGDILHVVLLRDQVHARCRAAADLVLHAGAGPVAEEAVGAGPERKDRLDHPEHLTYRCRRAVGSEVEVLSLAVAPGDHHPGPFLAEGDLEADVGLVVLQPDVVEGAMLLDEIVFEDQGLLLGLGQDAVKVVNPFQQQTDEGSSIVGFSEVGPHPAAQVDRLADVQDPAAGVLHDVDSR